MTPRLWSTLAALSLIVGAIALVALPSGTASSSPNAQSVSEDARVVQAFMALGPSPTPMPRSGSVSASETECIPCRDKAGAAAQGRVPSRPPPQISDEPYQRLTGRNKDFHLPAETGTALIDQPVPMSGWMVVTTGMPYRQMRCHVQITGSGGVVSRVSGATIHAESVTMEFGQSPRQELAEFGPVLTHGLREIAHLAASLVGKRAPGEILGHFRVVSASGKNLVVVPQNITWTHAAQEDVSIHLDQRLRVASWEHVTANVVGSTWQASRIVWFPEYSDP